MNTIQAIIHLANDPNSVVTGCNEWIQAGLWYATCRILADHAEGKAEWTPEEVDALLRDANDN